MTANGRLRIAHLYPRLMNIYGDRGNILALTRRAHARGYEVDVSEIGTGDELDIEAFDLIFAGGAQDRDQRRVADDLRIVKGDAIRDAAERDVVVLAVCGAYQLFGKEYTDGTGARLPGLGLFDIRTEHPGADAQRLVGNVVAELEPDAAGWRGGTLVGFENHGGRTVLGPTAQPLARVRSGHGNNGRDGTEGARYRNAFGTYLHGSLLPKNPRFADRLIALALSRGGDTPELAPLDDRLELNAHNAALRLGGR